MKSHLAKHWFTYLIILLATSCIIYLMLDRYQLRQEMKEAIAQERRQSLEKEMAARKSLLEAMLQQQLLLHAKMIEAYWEDEDWTDIGQYFATAVRSTALTELSVVSAQGKVLAAYPEQLVGVDVVKTFPAGFLAKDLSVQHLHQPSQTKSSLRLERDGRFLGHLVLGYSDEVAGVNPH